MAQYRIFIFIAVMLLLSASACGLVREPVITPVPSSTAIPPATLEPTPAVSAPSTHKPLPTATQPLPPQDIGPFRGVTSLPEALTPDGGEMRLRTSADGSVWILTSQAALRWYGRGWETVLSGSEVCRLT